MYGTISLKMMKYVFDVSTILIMLGFHEFFSFRDVGSTFLRTT
jgi:hypothetical protein